MLDTICRAINRLLKKRELKAPALLCPQCTYRLSESTSRFWNMLGPTSVRADCPACGAQSTWEIGKDKWLVLSYWAPSAKSQGDLLGELHMEREKGRLSDP